MNSLGQVAGREVAQPASQPIPAAMEQAAVSAAHLHDLITELEKRLSAVLAAPAPEPVASGEARNQPIRSLAQQIEGHASVTRFAGERLERLLNRLEL